jgi:hypothetical protein
MEAPGGRSVGLLRTAWAISTHAYVSRSITPDSRLSRRPDALPVLSGEIDYAGRFSAEDKFA